MKQLLFDLFLVALGAGIGITTLCLIQAGSSYDKEMERFERREK